jgi:hypothetical protein
MLVRFLRGLLRFRGEGVNFGEVRLGGRCWVVVGDRGVGKER